MQRQQRQTEKRVCLSGIKDVDLIQTLQITSTATSNSALSQSISIWTPNESSATHNLQPKPVFSGSAGSCVGRF